MYTMGNYTSTVEALPAVYDWKPDLPDTRDVYFHYNKLTNSQKQLDIIDLRGKFGIELPKYPTSTSNCVAMVLEYFKESFEMPGGVSSIRDCCKLVNIKDNKSKKILYQRIQNTLAQMKRSLIDGYPIITGLTIFDSTIADLKSKDGVIKMPNETDNIVGGICVVICGFNLEMDQWIVKTSRCEYGDGGYLYVPFKYFEREGGDYWRLSVEKID